MPRVLTIDFKADTRELEAKAEECKVDSKNRLGNAEIYRLGNFDMMERVAIKEGLDVLVDEEGAGKYNYVTHLGMRDSGKTHSLFGKILFVGVDSDMYYTPLSDEQIHYIAQNMSVVVSILKEGQQH